MYVLVPIFLSLGKRVLYFLYFFSREKSDPILGLTKFLVIIMKYEVAYVKETKLG